MDPLITPLVEALKTAVPFVETRSAPPSGDQLEAVLLRPNLQRCYTVLSEAFGPPIKEFGVAMKFAPDVSKIIARLGGIRTEQCLFLRPCAGQGTAYAALWPWASDPTRVTLKVGIFVA